MLPPASDWRDAIEYAANSDVGLRRANNQDSFVVVVSPEEHEWLRRGHLFMVADGMGAHAAGELASKMATDFVSLNYFKAPDESPVDAVQKAFQEANNRVYARGQSNPDFRGMGTTASALLLLPEGAVVAHVGDSRVYRLRGNRLDQLSFDHSLVWEMRANATSADTADFANVPKNIITRSLGPYSQVQIDLEGPFPIEVDDTFLLCSDGLSGQVDDEEIGCILSALPPGEAIQSLVDLANLRGGPDNITVIVARVASPKLIGSEDELSPARARAPAGSQKVHPVAWIVLGVLGLAALSMLILGKYPAAAIAGAAAAATAIFIAVRHFSVSASKSVAGSQLGKGPYRTTTCTANLAFAERLAKVVNQLRAAAVEEAWQIDWDRFNAYGARAAAASAKQNFGETVREHCHAISFMMDQLRHQSQREPKSDGQPHIG